MLIVNTSTLCLNQICSSKRIKNKNREFQEILSEGITLIIIKEING
jgi:hypothetical protein